MSSSVSCSDISDQEKRTKVKIKPIKGRPAQKPQSPLPVLEEDLQSILSTRWIDKEPVVGDPASSPPLKAQPRRWLSSLTHTSACVCPCCSEPCLGRVTALWAATQADLVLQLDPADVRVSLKLQSATLARCKNVEARLDAKLAQLFPSCGKGVSKPTLMHDVMGSFYLHVALSGLEPNHNKISALWRILEAGLAFVDAVASPSLRPVKAGLMATKAIMSLVSLAAKMDCTPEELLSRCWTWNGPKEDKEMMFEEKTAAHSSILKEPKGVPDKDKGAKKVRVTKPKSQGSSLSAKGKSVLPVTPAVVKSKSSVRELSAFDFNTIVPTFACTPVQRVKGPASAHKAPRTASKLHFHVFEELSPAQDKALPVPAAPRRTKKSRFKVST